MGIYSRYVLPRLITLVMQNKVAAAERAKLVPLASGKVLEVGIGSGLNLPFYTRNVDTLVGLDPSGELWKLARRRAAHVPFAVEYMGHSSEEIPIAEQTFDTVVITWTLCTIPDPLKALEEMRRVLKPDGRLLFVEHGLAPDRRVQVWQRRLNPLWRRVAGGCNLNRSIDTLIQEAGFRLSRVETGYVRGPRPFSFFYRGSAHLPQHTNPGTSPS